MFKQMDKKISTILRPKMCLSGVLHDIHQFQHLFWKPQICFVLEMGKLFFNHALISRGLSV